MRFAALLLCVPLSASVITVGTVCNGPCSFPNNRVQAAIDSAKGGDILELSAEETFPTQSNGYPFYLKQHAGVSIIIRSNRWKNLPINKRVSRADAPNLPKLCTPNTINQGVIGTDKVVPVSGWHLQALWITVCAPGQQNAGDLVVLGDTYYEKLPDQQSSDFVIDQCLITGWDDYDTGPKRGVAVNARNVEIRNTFIANIKGTVVDGSETHGLGGWNASDVTITNTRISSGTENFLFGGARAPWPGQTTTNIELVGSLLEKDLDWNFLNWPHDPVVPALPATCIASSPDTIIAADKMYICDNAGKWWQANWVAGRQPECLSDETGGVHWRNTSTFPSKVWDCINGKWQAGGFDRMHAVTRMATDVVEGTTTRIYSTTLGMINLDWNDGTWVVINGVTGACAGINRPWQIKKMDYHYLTIAFDSSACGQIVPAELRMQFQFSNWDTKNMGEFKNVLGATVRGSVFRNCLFPTWGNQKCRSFLLNLTSEQDGPASTLSEITFVNNKFYHAPGGIDQGIILCDANNIVYASKIVRGKPTQLLDSGCSFIVGDNITVTGAPATGPWAALNGTHSVIDRGIPGFGGDAFIPLDSSAFPAPDFNVSVSMDLPNMGPNRRPHDITIENNVFKYGHPDTITGGYIGGARQFTQSSSATYWYSFDIGRMSYVSANNTTYRHNTVTKPEHGLGYNLLLSLVPSPGASSSAPKPQLINYDNIWEGNQIMGYASETPCTKAISTYSAVPMFAAGNLATGTTVDCLGFTTTDRETIAFTDYYQDNFRLSPASKFANTASDGSNPGADQNVVDWETEGAITGEFNPYLTMQLKTVEPTASSVSVEYIGYDTSPCEVAVSAGVRRFPAIAPAEHNRIGRRGTVTVGGLQPRTNHWLRLTCAGRYRERNFSTL